MRKKLSRFFGKPVVKWTLRVLVTLAVVSGLLWLIWIGYSYDWTGFNSYINAKGEPERARTLWNWLELLIVPTVLAVGALLFNRSERRAEREIADKRAQQDRDLASHRAQEVALQSYLDKMTELLLENGLRESEQASEVRVIAKARTLTALTGLDGSKRALLLGFLYEAALVTKGEAVIDLRGANLSGAYLDLTNLSGANLIEAILHEAHLFGADLSGAHLSGANLDSAYLSTADLSAADLHRAYLRLADLGGAILFGADLSEANLTAADLHQAYLDNANLSKADLSYADLTSATVSEEQLAQATSLRGATMPDGTKHE